MKAFARKIAALLCVLALVLVPAVGGAKGGGGLVNLPGGGSLNGTAGAGMGGEPIVRTTAEDLTLVLDPTMFGSIVVVGSPGNLAKSIMTTTSGRYVVTTSVMATLVQAGVQTVELLFVAPNFTTLRVDLSFAEGGQVAVLVK